MRNFIVGTDWWDDCDDAVAMRLLARAHKAGEIRLLGVGINVCMDHAAASMDGFLRVEGVGDVPIGLDFDAEPIDGQPLYQKVYLPFCGEYRSNEDAERAIPLYRRLLAESDDPVELVEIGYLTVLAALLDSPADDISQKTGLELVSEKVKKVWVMAGRWDTEGWRENNFARSQSARTAAARVCDICPAPITFLGFEVGADVISGNLLSQRDVLYHGMCQHGSPYGRPSWDPMLALLALVGDEEAAGYRVVSGTARVDAETGLNAFAPDPAGRHRYVIKARENAYYQAAINERL